MITTILIKLACRTSKYSTTDTAAGIKKKAMLLVRKLPTSSTSSNLTILIFLFNKNSKNIINPKIVPGK